MRNILTSMLLIGALISIAALTFWFRSENEGRSSVKGEKSYERPSAAAIAVAPAEPGMAQESEVLSLHERSALPTKLQIELIGTVVKANSKESFGTVRTEQNGKASNQITGSKISNLAAVTSVRREKLYFTNLINGNPEYIRISSFRPDLSPTSQKISDALESELHVRRESVEQALANLPALLGQARAIPMMSPAGEILGYRLDFVQAGSIFEKLGLKAGDELNLVNGEKIDSPAKALQLLNELKNSSQIILQITRNGQVRTARYLVR
ncbi:MAG: hypothetical protein EOP06_25020 [Proteobacteria bacterium]|nr:MAG: hypothetical protein EOP06_25020 [Pseudomonadota bacterium]